MEDSPPGTQLTERLTDEAVSWMESVHEEPFLLYLSWYAVHTPLQTKPEYKEYYQQKRSQLPEQEGEPWGQERERKVRRVQDHAVYAGMVQSLDESVGRLLGRLEELGLTGRTLVVFTSDNGGLSTSEGHPTSNLPLRGGKGWLYEGGIREPMLVRWPGVTDAGSVCHTPVISMDVYPTVLSAAGLDQAPEQHVDGMNLLPLLQGGTVPGRALYWHYPHYGNQGAAPSGAVRSGDWKLVEWFEDGTTELFDLGADPGESRNLAPEQPGRTAALQASLKRWRQGVQAKMPRPNPNFGK
jgi:arylsulfatase A-like enzyme